MLRPVSLATMAQCGAFLAVLIAGCGNSEKTASAPSTAGASPSSATAGTGGVAPAAPSAGSGTPAAGATGAAAGGGSGRSAGSAGSGSGAAGSPAAPGPDAAAPSAPDSGTEDASGGQEPVAPGPASSPFPSVTDFTGNGPYEATTLTMTGPNGNYTVYLPTSLPSPDLKSPIVGWMSGGGTTPDGYPLLPHLATHGFAVIASNTAPAAGDEVNLGAEILAGIDWAIAENAKEGSPLFGKLDESKIASMGYSMGSLASFVVANDPRLTTTVHISGGNMLPERIKNLHAPAAFFCGIPGDDSCNILSSTCDIAAANCDTDFANATTPVFYANFNAGHLGILTAPTQDQIHTEITAWLRWKLMSDGTIESRFVGDQCGVCQDSNWKVQQKNL